MPSHNSPASDMYNIHSQICQNPQKVLMKSYGVYGVSSQIEFNFADWSYLENDYIIAIPHIRGGSDLGMEWHSSTLKSLKMKSVFDLIDCFTFLESKSLFLYNINR
jgi:oligopeptidase B